MAIERIGTRIPTVAAHLTGWAIFVTLSWYFTLMLNPLPSRDATLGWSTILLIALFYANYTVFIPRIETKLHLLLYSLLIAAALMLYYRIPEMLTEMPAPGTRPRMHNGTGFNQGMGRPRGELRRQLTEYGRARLILFALIYAFSTSAGILKLINRHRQKQQQAEHEKSKAQLQLLSSQVNPHFLFNTLNAIYYLTAGKSDKAPEAVLQLADIMRYTLQESQSELVAVKDEISFIEKYIALQQLRLSDKTTIDITLPQHVEGLMIAPLLLIPYIENCFKYGVSTHSPSSISIKISISPQRELKASMSNRIFGKGEGGGFGMSTAALRLAALYPERHKIEIFNASNVFTVLLLIKL